MISLKKQSENGEHGSKNNATSTVDYTYNASGWKDQLTSYGDQQITYDAIGNPLLIYNDFDAYQTGYLLEWEGRQLKSYSEFESSDINYPDVLDSFTYTYNADGIRTSKTVYGITYEYILNGSQPIGMRWTQSGTEYLMLFIYDDMGAPIALKYRTSAYAVGVFDTYFFEKNFQGDIIAIYDETGSQIGTYKYNAWGALSWSCASGASAFERSLVYDLNPFRYRGYIYDFETGLYYLQSRYYNPNWGRFLNADGSVSTGQGFIGNNMFAYCNNNPVNGCDPCGTCFHHLQFWKPCDNCLKEKIIKLGMIYIDAKKFDMSNTDVQTVYDSYYFSAYKGTLVIRHSNEFLSSWGVFGTIFLNHDTDNLSLQRRTDTLNHEYGHILQEKDYGIPNYLTTVAMPSMIYNLASRNNQFLNDNYYNMPWEYDADIRGGVTRSEHISYGELIVYLFRKAVE